MVPLAPDAPGDNRLVYTAPGPELTQPHDSSGVSLLERREKARCW